MKTQSQTQERTHFSPIQRSQQQAASGSMSANHHLNTDLDTRMRVMYCVFFLLLVSANVGQAVPVPRMFSKHNSKTILQSISSLSSRLQTFKSFEYLTTVFLSVIDWLCQYLSLAVGSPFMIINSSND